MANWWRRLQQFVPFVYRASFSPRKMWRTVRKRGCNGKPILEKGTSTGSLLAKQVIDTISGNENEMDETRICNGANLHNSNSQVSFQ